MASVGYKSNYNLATYASIPLYYAINIVAELT